MRVDGVVLDIDGVLVDVVDSYRRAIVETVEYLYGNSIPRSAVQLFKNAGGFNNDWELTDAVALFVIARERAAEFDIEGYTDAIAAAGGGVAGAKQVILERCDNAHSVLDAWEPEAIRSVFQQLYLGTDLYRKLETGSPEIECPGFIHDEEILISDSTVDYLVSTYQVGVFTGRPDGEAALALDRVGLEVCERHRITMDSTPPGKPAPDGLVLLGDRLGVQSIVYVGDTLDDMKTAVNANDSDPSRSYRGVGVQTGGLTGGSGRDALLSADATNVIKTVNELPSVLR
jgi:HAD superfamily hydrolase (TIGR01548 family)